MNDLRELIESDPLDRTSPPDLGALIRDGRRVQRRRRAAGAAGALALAAVAVGGVVLSSGGTSTPEFANEPPASHTPRHARSHHQRAQQPQSRAAVTCPVADAIFLCEQPPAERRAPTGDVVPIGHRADGSPEVLYAVQEPGFDQDSGQPQTIVALKAGLQRTDGLHGYGIGLQPGADSVHLAPIPMSGGTQRDRYAIVGDVKGDPGTVTWTDARGDTHPVTGQSTTLVPGYTVFWLYGPGTPAYDFDTVVVHAGSASCALADCAAQGGM